MPKEELTEPVSYFYWYRTDTKFGKTISMGWFDRQYGAQADIPLSMFENEKQLKDYLARILAELEINLLETHNKNESVEFKYGLTITPELRWFINQRVLGPNSSCSGIFACKDDLQSSIEKEWDKEYRPRFKITTINI